MTPSVSDRPERDRCPGTDRRERDRPALDRPGVLLDPASPAMGDHLRAAWRSGDLLPGARPSPHAAPAPSAPHTRPAPHASDSPPPSGAPSSPEVRAALAGVGERFAAWRVTPRKGAALIVRIPHVASDAPDPSLTREIAALALIPAEVGPSPIAVHDDPGTSPIGHPYVVTSDVPGTVASPDAWTDRCLAVHAAALAHLHTVPAPGRGPVTLGADPWAAVPPGPQSLLAEVEEEAAAWRTEHGPVIADHGLDPFLEAALARAARIEPDLRTLDGFVLAHGDLCATNILWRPAAAPPTGADDRSAADGPTVRYIDFEWAQGDDPARDLAIIGGAVHGGPWYLPLEEEQVAAFVDAYVSARRRTGELPASVADTASLRDRMRAWTAYERTAMLVHVASRASTRSLHRRVLPVLRGTLARELGLPG